MKRALVVDDSRAMRHLVAAGLAPWFDVEIAVDGLDALERILAEPFDLVLTDLDMPRLNGMALYREVHRWNRNLPVVLVTDTDVERLLPMAEKSEMGYILPKAMLQVGFDTIVHILNGLTQRVPMRLADFLAPGGECRTWILSSPSEITALTAELDAILRHYPRADLYKAALGVLLQNALTWGRPATGFGPGAYVQVSVGADARRVGLSVRDPAGSLRRREMLTWLAQPMAEGSRGWSFQVLRRIVDVCAVSLWEGCQTEVVCLDLLEGYEGARPLVIYEHPS